MNKKETVANQGSSPAGNETRAYICSHFITLKELAHRAGSTVARIEEFIECKCLPCHSYEIEENNIVRSFFGERVGVPTVTRFFSPALVAWASEVEERSNSQTLEEIALFKQVQFSDQYCQLIVEMDGRSNGFSAYFDAAGALCRSSIDQHLVTEWDYVLDGTYALCTPRSRVEEIVEKGVMAHKIERITKNNTRPKESLDTQERLELTVAVKRLDAVCSSFAPDELEQSTRHCRIDYVVQRYALKLEDFLDGSPSI